MGNPKKPMMPMGGPAMANKGIDNNPKAIPQLPKGGITEPNQASMTYLNLLKGPRTNITLPKT